MLLQSKMLQLCLIIFISLLTSSHGEHNHTACKKLCITASERKTVGYDPVLYPVHISIPKCSIIYNNVSCYYVKHAPTNECQPLCLPSSSKIVTKQLRTGPKSYKIIKGCHFVEGSCRHCKRRSYAEKYFEFSKYVTEVDIGRCTGLCDSEGGACVPVKNVTTTIHGPNGAITVSVIEKCSCESSCYRFSYQEAFLERNESNYPEITEKVIDIGKCAGSCKKNLPGKCLSIDKRTGHCLYRLAPRRALCRPTNGTTVTFTRVDGMNITVPIVTECGCTYG